MLVLGDAKCQVSNYLSLTFVFLMLQQGHKFRMNLYRNNGHAHRETRLHITKVTKLRHLDQYFIL